MYFIYSGGGDQSNEIAANCSASIGLVAVLVLTLTSVSLAAPDRPNGVIDVKLIDQGRAVRADGQVHHRQLRLV